MVTLEFHIGTDPVIRVLIEEHTAQDAVDMLRDFCQAMNDQKDELFDLPTVGVGKGEN